MATARRFVIHFHCSFPWCAARVALWKSNCPFFMLGCSVPLALQREIHPSLFPAAYGARVGDKPWRKSPAPFHCHSWLSPSPSASFGNRGRWVLRRKTARDWQWSNRDYVFFILFQYLASAVLWRHHSIDIFKTLTIDVFDISSGVKQHLFLLPSLVQARNIYLGQFEKQSYHTPSLLQCFEASLCFSLWACPAFIPIYLSTCGYPNFRTQLPNPPFCTCVIALGWKCIESHMFELETLKSDIRQLPNFPPQVPNRQHPMLPSWCWNSGGKREEPTASPRFRLTSLKRNRIFATKSTQKISPLFFFLHVYLFVPVIGPRIFLSALTVIKKAVV